MADTSLRIGGGKWAVKEDSLLGYNVIQNKYVPIEMDTVRATTATRVNSEGLIETSPVNLVQQSETFDNAGWTKDSGASVTANTTTAPNGTTTADTLTVASGQYMYQGVSLVVAQSYTISVYLRVASGTKQFKFNTYSGIGNDFTSSAYTATTEWQRFEYTFTTIASGTTNIYPVMVDGLTGGAFFIWGAQLNIGATAKPYFPTTDRLNIPRIDYTSGQGAILVEPQRTNLILRSEEFENASWAKLNTTITQNTTIAPDGNLTADKIVENNTAGLHRMYTISSCSASATYTASIFVKKSERTRFEFLETTLGGCIFDLTNGTIVSGTDGFIESYNNDWYRCGIKRTTSVSQSVFVIQVRLIISGTNNNYLGDGTSGVFIWGAQLEAGSYPTSYIPTVASTVTRNADVISKTGISSLINGESGTLFLNSASLANDGTTKYFSINNGTTNYEIVFQYSSTSNTVGIRYINGGFAQCDASVLITNALDFNKFAFTWQLNKFELWCNGIKVISDTSGSVTTGFNQIDFRRSNGTIPFFSKVKSVALYKTALTDTELITLTTI